MKSLIAVAVLLAMATCWSPTAFGADLASRNRHNLFDPIFGYDELDTHTVSAARSAGQSQAKQAEPKAARQPNQPQLFSDDEPPSSRAPKRKSTEASQQSSTDKRAPTSPSSSASTLRPLVTPGISVVPEPRRTTRRDATEEPRYWSALENYYAKLRQSAVSSAQQQQLGQSNNYQPIYQVIQQAEADDSLSAYRPLNTYSMSAPYASSGLSSLISNSQQSGAKPPMVLLQIVNPRQPSSDPDFGFSVHQNAAPGISRTGGIGASSILLPAQPDRSQVASPYDFQVKSAPRATLPPRLGSTTNVGYQSPTSLDDVVRPDSLEWRKLPELLFIQQQQQRIKHQQETFGEWYDHQRSRELLQEEAYCGPRNYLANLIEPVQSSPRPSEYPSHMGVYNGSTEADSNYLCAATWVHDQFALTLASCLREFDVSKLVVRAGEWSAFKSGGANERPTALRRLEQVSVFPKYRSNSSEHDLALLKFTKPLDYLEVTPLCPACQVQSRSSIRASSCWAPVRNTTVSEYFDADGEGETKLKKSVRMLDLPVKLIAQDNNECFRQTKLEYFNFQHPNYICSADFKGALWRSSLNQTDYFGSGIYCNEGGNLSLVSILHPIHSNSSSAFGFLDLSYYKPWMRNVISGRGY